MIYSLTQFSSLHKNIALSIIQRIKLVYQARILRKKSDETHLLICAEAEHEALLKNLYDLVILGHTAAEFLLGLNDFTDEFRNRVHRPGTNSSYVRSDARLYSSGRGRQRH